MASKPNGLTAKEILLKTTPRTQGASRDVKILEATPKVLRGGFAALRCRTIAMVDIDGNIKPGTPKKHVTTAYATEPDKRLHLSKLKVSCSCEAHVFYGGEYALWRKGAADIKYGNGEPPVVNNPRLVPWACKHIARVLRSIITRKV